MAQWLGQHNGRTHATKVADREAMLREAISQCLAADSDTDTPQKVSSLARKVVDARLKSMRAQLSDLREPKSGAMPLQQIERMERRIRELESGGISATLQEFRCLPQIIEIIIAPAQP